MTTHLNGLADLAQRFDAFLIDYWGVLYNGTDLYPQAISSLAQLKKTGKKIVLLTNAPRRSNVLIKEIERQGIPRTFLDGLLTSGDCVHHALKEKKAPFFRSLKKNLYHLGPERNSNLFDSLTDYTQVGEIEEADFILTTGSLFVEDSLDTYHPLLGRALARDLPMICANPDRRSLRHGRENIGAGAIATTYERMGGRVKMRGKPDADLYHYCLEGLGITDRQKVAVIGDSFETDIAGAEASGLHGFLVASGLHARELNLSAFGDKPTPHDVDALARHYGLFPTGVLPAFIW